MVTMQNSFLELFVAFNNSDILLASIYPITYMDTTFLFLPGVLLLKEIKAEETKISKIEVMNEAKQSLGPIYEYNNIIGSRSQIQSDLKGKCGIYQFININDPTKTYVGSSIELWERMRYHIRTGDKTNYTYVSLLYRGVAKYTWSGFKLVILELTENNKEVLLVREQYYLDLFKPYYNILSEAGSPAGRVLSEETRLKISQAVKGEKNGMFGKTHSKHSKELMSLAQLGQNNHQWGKQLPESTKLALSIAKGTTIYVYSSDKSKLIYTFNSARKAAEFFNINHNIILKYAKKGIIYKGLWFFFYYKYFNYVITIIR